MTMNAGESPYRWGRNSRDKDVSLLTDAKNIIGRTCEQWGSYNSYHNKMLY